MNGDTNGLAAPMIEIALMDGELEEANESYHITMSGAVFGAWMSKNVSKNCVECVVNNDLDGRTIAICITEGGNELSEVLMNADISDEKRWKCCELRLLSIIKWCANGRSMMCVHGSN